MTVWPEEVFALRPVGVMTLNRNITDYHIENEQVAFGTGVLVNGFEFDAGGADLLVLRHAVPRRPELPAVAGERANPHVTYEPSSRAGLCEADESYRDYRPFVSGEVAECDKHMQEKDGVALRPVR